MRSEHLVVDGKAMPWLDAFSRLRSRGHGRADRYHVAEVFNLAALYLTSYLRKQGLRAEPISLFSGERDRLAALLADRPAVVAITTTFYVNILPVGPVVEFIRQLSPSSHIVVGGPLVDNLCVSGVTSAVQDFFFAMGADSYIQESQGEQSLARLCHAVRDGADLATVDNLIHCPDGAWVRTRRLREQQPRRVLDRLGGLRPGAHRRHRPAAHRPQLRVQVQLLRLPGARRRARLGVSGDGTG